MLYYLVRISDNNKKNRIIVFASPTGLKMLSLKVKKYIWTEHYTLKLDTLNNYEFYMHHLVRKKYENNDEVWVKRTIPVAWAFMQR
jgi:hypothetical protein